MSDESTLNSSLSNDEIIVESESEVAQESKQLIPQEIYRIVKRPIGRPSVIGQATLSKLEEAFAMGCSDIEACLWANIGSATLYNYQNRHPDFVERKNELKNNPVLLARRTVHDSLAKDVNSAWRYLERKDPTLNPKASLDVTTGGEPLVTPASDMQELSRKFDDFFKQQNA